MKVFWQPNKGPQEEALRRSEFEILYGGARGGGKTEAGLVWAIEPHYLQNPKYRFLVIRKNFKDLSNWIDRARMMYAPLGAEIVGNPPEIRFKTGAIGRAGHLNDAGAYEQYLGHEYQKMIIEELTLIPSEESYIKLISAARSTVENLSPQIFCTTNPGNAGHIWVKNRFVGKCPHCTGIPPKPFRDPNTGRWRMFIPARAEDTPQLAERDPAYLQWLKGLPEKLRKAWWEGCWDIFEGQYFDTWDEQYHVYEPFDIPKDWPRFRAIDWGYSDYFCCLWFAVGPKNHVYVYREFYRNRLTDSEYAEAISSLSKYPDGSDEQIQYTVGDPNSFWVRVQETGVARWETYALNGIPILKADNSHLSGWGRVREYLQIRDMEDGNKKSWLHISKECPNLIRTLPTLVHDEKMPEDVADGMEDHAPDALRYGLQSRAPVHVQSVQKYRDNYEAAYAQKIEQMRREEESIWR